jgi:hypothetical protein
MSGGAGSAGAGAGYTVPLWRWVVWSIALFVALVVFYGIFTPFWFGLRSVAWVAEYRARRRRRAW